MLKKTDEYLRLSHDGIVTDYRRRGHVAHAMGAFGGTAMTNAPEAFHASYNAGYRFFEADLLMLGDGTAAVVHDRQEAKYSFAGLFHKSSWEEVRLLRYNVPSGQEVSPIMSLYDFVGLMYRYPDVYFVTDAKAMLSGDEPVRIWAQLVEIAPESVLKRIYPHLRDERELKELQSMFDWTDYMLALYRTQWQDRMTNDEVVDFVLEADIGGVMMWYKPNDPDLSLKDNSGKHQRFDLDFAGRLQACGVGVYVHDMTRPEQAAPFQKLGVGVYSKGWLAQHDAQSHVPV